ncbi:hypothetical protein JZ751_022611, partial [Albula glossodonta]
MPQQNPNSLNATLFREVSEWNLSGWAVVLSPKAPVLLQPLYCLFTNDVTYQPSNKQYLSRRPLPVAHCGGLMSAAVGGLAGCEVLGLGPLSSSHLSDDIRG